MLEQPQFSMEQQVGPVGRIRTCFVKTEVRSEKRKELSEHWPQWDEKEASITALRLWQFIIGGLATIIRIPSARLLSIVSIGCIVKDLGVWWRRRRRGE